MTGTSENLVNRISHVARHVARSSKFSVNEIIGASVIFCGGCMMAIKPDMGMVAERLNGATGSAACRMSHVR